MGVQESQNCTVITMRMKHRRMRWSANTFNGALEDNYKNMYKSRFYNADINGKSYVYKRRVLDNGLPNPNRDKRYWILEDRSAIGDSS